MKDHGFSIYFLRAKRLWYLPLLGLFLFVSLACRLSLGGPTPPPERTLASAAREPQDWRTVLENARPGENINLTLTEGELTDIVANQVQSVQGATIQNPRVVLRDGQMEVYGQVITQDVSANFRSVLTVNVDAASKPHLNIVSADFGPVPVPSSLRQRLSDSLDQTLADAINPASTHFKTSQINITDGLMTIQGMVEP